MESDTVITLRGMEFWAYHGCLPEEEVVGNRFEVDVRLWLNTEKAQRSDALTDTLNYALVYERVNTIMKERANLLEHVGHKIVEALLAEFAQLKRVEVEVRKYNPPLGGILDSVGVTLQGERTHG